MTNKYEALLALDTRGKDDNAKEAISRIEKLFAAESASISEVKHLERREFAYEHNHAKSGYFISINFTAEAPVIDKLRAKLKLDEEVLLQNFIKL